MSSQELIVDLVSCFYAFLTALFAALLMVPAVHRWAREKGSVDHPDPRKVHTEPVPRLGGIAIFLACLLALLGFAPFNVAMRGILAGTLVVFVTGIADDLNGLSARQKFVGQIASALVMIVLGQVWLVDLGNLFGFGVMTLPFWLAIPFTVFAVVGVINAINLIDGLDGLAGGVSVIALAAFALLGFQDDDLLSVLLAMSLAGAILGFLKYNFYPARIFMGDTGSMVVGFLLAALAIHLTQRPDSTISPMLPVLILGLPIFDAVWVMTRRLLHRTSPFAADRGHVHHKFLDLGFEHRFTVLVIYALSLFWAASALVLQRWPEYLLLLYLIGTALLCYLGLRHLIRHRDRYGFLQRDAEKGLRQTVLFVRGADLVDRLLPLLALLLGLFALLAGWVALADGHPGWLVALLLLAGGVVMRRLLADGGGEFQLLLVYALACLAAYVVWRSAEAALLFGAAPKRLGDLLLAATTLLVALKLLFRRSGEFFLASADFLALTLMAFLAIAAQQPQFGHNLAGPLLRAILVVLAARTFASRGPASRRLLINGSLLLLAVFALTGLR